MSNPVGWRSSIYTLLQAGDQAAPLHGVADDVAKAATRRILDTPRTPGDTASTAYEALPIDLRLAYDVDDTRGMYRLLLDGARSGKYPDSSMPVLLDAVASGMRSIEQLGSAGANPVVLGHVGTARRAAETVAANLRAGAKVGDVIDEPTHMAMWRLRDSLDEAWQQVGMAKVAGAPAAPAMRFAS